MIVTSRLRCTIRFTTSTEGFIGDGIYMPISLTDSPTRRRLETNRRLLHEFYYHSQFSLVFDRKTNSRYIASLSATLNGIDLGQIQVCWSPDAYPLPRELSYIYEDFPPEYLSYLPLWLNTAPRNV